MIDLPDNVFGFAIIPRTALRPNQQPYWGVVYLEVPPETWYAYYIGAGFSETEEWIPLGRRFSIWYAVFTATQNSLIKTAIGVESQENPGYVTILTVQFGYGKTEYPAGVFFEFEPGTRPWYYVFNYSSNTIGVYATVFGVTEVII